MKRMPWIFALGVAMIVVAWGSMTTFSASAADEVVKSGEQQGRQKKLLTVDEARQRAKLMHKIYESTLDVMHHRYFRDDLSTIPARAMEDVFFQIARQTDINARWIAVNARAMNIKHKPRDEFEKNAVKALKARKTEYEFVEGETYRRAQVILLDVSCLSCHDANGIDPNRRRVAALTISIPVQKSK